MTGSGSEGHARSVGRVLRVLAIGALMAMAIAVSVPVGAAGDNDQVTCIPINYTTCMQPLTGAYTAPVAPYTVPYTAPAAPTTQMLPGNSLVTTYTDPRYCGDGLVSVVTDSTGHLIDVCTSTGIRIYPAFPDYPGFAPYAGYFGNGYAPAYLNGTYVYNSAPIAPYTGNFVNGYYGAPFFAGGYNQYTDNRFCGDGQITQTAQGYFCTTSGVPAYRSS